MGVRDGLLAIGEVADRAGLRPSALRYYEDAGLIRPVARAGGRRYYDPAVLRRLAIIALCQEAGFSIAEIGALLSASRPLRGRRWRGLAERKLAELDAHLAAVQDTKRLLEQVLACGCENPATCDLVRGAPARRLLQIGSPPGTRRPLPLRGSGT